MSWYLKEIRLSGFKSFNRRTRIVLQQGLTAIVGSNGCGKTNIADAIRFAMGEMRPHQLRVEHLEDVIFTGTATLPPLAVTEVTLELVNSATNDFFSITRRLVRNGEAEYRIDGQISRLKDVQRKLEQIGISSQRGVVVELRQMDEVLYEGSKLPRQLVEEGCGIAPFLERKNQSETKLKAALDQLEKLVPRMEQMKEELVKLQEQAQKAKRWKRIKQALDFAKNNELWAEVRHLRNELNSIQKELTNVEQDLNIKNQLDILQSQIKTLEIYSVQLENQWNDLTNQLLTINRSREEAQHRKNKYEMEKVRVETRLTNLIQEKNELIREFKSIEKDPATNLYNDFNLAKKKQQDLEILLKQKENEFQELDAIQKVQQKEIDQYSSQKDLLLNRLSLFQNELESYQTRLNNLPEKKIFTEEALQSFHETFQKFTYEEHRINSLIQEKVKQFQKIQLEINELNKQLDELSKTNHEMNTDYHHKKRLLEERLDIQENLRQLIAPYVHQIEILRDKQDDIAFLHFRVSGTDRIKVPIDQLEKLISLALQHQVRCEWTTDFSNLKLVTLQKLLEEIPPQGEEWYAIEGVSRNASGIIRTSNPPDPSIPIGLPQQLEALVNQLQQNENQIKELNLTLHLKKEHLRSIHEEQSILQTNLAEILQKKSKIEQSIFLEKQNQARIEQENQLIEEEKKRLSELITTTLKQIDATKIEFNQLKPPELISSPISIDQLKNQLERIKHDLRQQESEIHQIELNLRTYEMNVEIRRKRRNSIQLRLNDIDTEISDLSKKKEEWSKEIHKINEEWQITIQQEEQIQKQRSTLQTQRNQITTELKEVRTQYESKRVEYEKLLTQQAILTEKKTNHQSYLSQKIKEAEETGPEPEETKKIGTEEIQRLSKRLEALEPVNHLAEIQYEDLQKQYSELEKESEEIKQAAEIHRKSVEEAVKHATELLTISKIRIQDSFSEIISRLFPGGEASLEWGEGDILTNAPLLLRVSPRGKKIRSLRVLSGGERALAALAFLVAVLNQQKSLPYIILDEVDAPLDEENTIRFLNWIRELTKHTQVLLLTHNRQSIASSNYWIGVTMPEPGVSQVVKVIPESQEEKL
ncbi:MAG: AAA family ATPase [bacterium]|nr:AAA family ATPase [bacterium]